MRKVTEKSAYSKTFRRPTDAPARIAGWKINLNTRLLTLYSDQSRAIGHVTPVPGLLFRWEVYDGDREAKGGPLPLDRAKAEAEQAVRGGAS